MRSPRSAAAATVVCSGVEASRTAFVISLEMAPRDRRVRVAGGDHLALLGELEPAVNRARSLGEDGEVRRSAPPDRSAAAVEQREFPPWRSAASTELPLRDGRGSSSPQEADSLFESE